LILWAADLRISTTRSSCARLACVPAGAFVFEEASNFSPPTEFVDWLDSLGVICSSCFFPDTGAEGVMLATSFTISSSILFSPSCLRKLLVTLITTANIGMSANSVA
jgi:hypothetical protein